MSRYRESVVTPTMSSMSLSGTTYNVNGTTSDWTAATGSYPSTPSGGEHMTDVVTPNFKALSASGQIINNPMESAFERLEDAVATYYNRIQTQYTNSSKTAWYGTRVYGMWSASSELGSFLSSPVGGANGSLALSLAAQATTTAHARASSSEIQGLVTVAEAGKTVGSIASIMRRALKIVKKAKRLEFMALANEISPKELQDRYMELRYAIRPLYYDLRGARDAYAKTLTSSQRITTRGYANGTASNADTYSRNDGNTFTVATRTVNVKVEARAGVLSDVDVSAASAWGLDQVLESMWEIVPFSFIVDWFLNVGETIAANSPSMGVRELASWSTVIATVTQQNSLASVGFVSTPPALKRDWTVSWSGTKSQLGIYKIRTPNPGLSVYPTVNVKLDALKLLDLGIIAKKFVF